MSGFFLKTVLVLYILSGLSYGFDFLFYFPLNSYLLPLW